MLFSFSIFSQNNRLNKLVEKSQPDENNIRNITIDGSKPITVDDFNKWANSVKSRFKILDYSTKKVIWYDEYCIAINTFSIMSADDYNIYLSKKNRQDIDNNFHRASNIPNLLNLYPEYRDYIDDKLYRSVINNEFSWKQYLEILPSGKHSDMAIQEENKRKNQELLAQKEREKKDLEYEEARRKAVKRQNEIESEIQNRTFTGNTTFKYSNGDSYSGDWVKGIKEGRGTYTWSSGQTYSGLWQNDYINGYGILQFDGWEYKGYFVDGKKNGTFNVVHNSKDFWGQYTCDFKGIITYENDKEVKRFTEIGNTSSNGSSFTWSWDGDWYTWDKNNLRGKRSVKIYQNGKERFALNGYAYYEYQSNMGVWKVEVKLNTSTFVFEYNPDKKTLKEGVLFIDDLGEQDDLNSSVVSCVNYSLKKIK